MAKKNPWSNLSLALNGQYDPNYTGVQALSDLQTSSTGSTRVTTNRVPTQRNPRLSDRRVNRLYGQQRQKPLITNRSFMDEYETHRSNVAVNPTLFESDLNRIMALV